MRRISIIFLLWMPLAVVAQTPSEGWDELMQQLSEELVDADDEQQWESQLELLTELHENPLDINSASREQLLALPFLSERAVDGILNYRAQNGRLRSLGELLLVGEMNSSERRWLHHFVKVSDEAEQGRGKTQSWWGKGRHEVFARADVPLYNRAGWSWSRGLANRWRYTWQQGGHLDAGLRAETDAGEAMMNRQTPLWDSYGGHVQLKEVGPLKNAVLGDFKVGFGEGLVLNNGLRLGKLSMGLWRTASGLRPHRSADEVNYLRGLGVTLDLGRQWQLTALYSYRKLDATVAADNTVQAINTTGLHRTEGELNRRGSLGSQLTALHAGKTFRFAPDARGVRPSSLRLGVTALYQYYDHRFRQGAQVYRQLLPDGYQFGAAGVNYGLQSSRLFFGGETARSFSRNARGDRGGWATLNKAAWRFSTNTQLAVIQRFYSQNYFSPYAMTYGENSRAQNESGVTLQLDTRHPLGVSLNAYVDYFYSPWPRYSMSRSSSGWEGMVQATYSKHRGRSLTVRYSVKSKEQSDRRHLSHRLRATYAHTFSPRWSGQLAGFLHRYHEEGGNSTGYALMPRVDFTSRSRALRLSLFGALFRSSDFDSRLYVYEPSLLQTFGMQQLYGHGQRLGSTLKWQTRNGRWAAQLKAGVTHYSDRDEISSGVLRIDSSWKADVQLLCRLLLR